MVSFLPLERPDDSRSALARALLASGLQAQPQNVGQGISSAGNAIIGALLARQAQAQQQEERAGARATASTAIGQLLGQSQQPVPDPGAAGPARALAAGQAAPRAPDQRAALMTLLGNEQTAESPLVSALLGRALEPPPETFEPVIDQQGRVVGQMSSRTGQVVSDPRTPGPPQTDIGKLRADLRAGNISDTEFAQARSKLLSDEIDSEKQFANADKLRDEFRASSKDFITSRDAYQRVLASGQDPSPAGDLSLIFNYMKVLDPGSVVRESEFATAAATGSFGARIQALVSRIASGERLADSVRDDFVDRAGVLFAKQLQSQDALRGEYTRLASRFGLSPDDVLVDFRAGADEALQKSQTERDARTAEAAGTRQANVGGAAPATPQPPADEPDAVFSGFALDDGAAIFKRPDGSFFKVK